MENKNFKIASLFSGCGGLDLGFIGGFKHFNYELPKLPFEIVFSNDIDKDAVSIYKENSTFFKHNDIVHDDIQNINPSDLKDFDILTAGFPCQPFSNAGLRKGINDNRGTLFEEVFRFISKKEPKIVVLENVRGILSSKMNNGKKVTDEIIDRLKKVETYDNKFIEYNVSSPMLIKASDTGVPQNRYRVIIIAVQKDLSEAPNIEDILSHSIKVQEEDLTVKKVLDYNNTLNNVSDVWDLSPQAKNLAPYIKRSWKDIPYEYLPDRMKRIRDNMKKYRSPNFYRRFAYHEINGTITASAQPENCGILHPIENRRYNVREIARIQSFPDNFTFNSVSIQNKYKVIGNAVPPVMGYAIAKTCLSLLSNIK
ncbi:DNA cytosine methyltransferase [Aliarcobacter butzleri]|uniref:DNA cytosine methyltransferase n=1 Tax=Aliarcobacter butzleri TaxID=28197 RepID=UPI0021B462F9|nr:DNA cytosine methyltransferase [Aliarcobacter butzleri]MCT7635321.1 DNA cytosine methyltransferase [Aliarcobacter butzleri]